MIYVTDDNVRFHVSAEQSATLDKLTGLHGGGMAVVHGYTAVSRREIPEVANINFITAFSTERLYQRKIKALESITFNDVLGDVLTTPKLSDLSNEDLFDLFNARKAQEINSLQRSLDGERDDAYRAAHDRCYAHVAKGVKVHYVTEAVKYVDESGKTKTRKEPVLTDGLPTCDSIMISMLEIGRKVIQQGVYKTVNSGVSVLMGNAINRQLNSRSVGIKTLSLKPDNFESLKVSKLEIVPEDMIGLITT